MSDKVNNEVIQEVVEETPKKKKREKKPKSKALKIIEWVLLGIFLLVFGFLGAAQIDGMVNKAKNNDEEIRFGVGTFIVLTNSMEPLYKTQSALITYKEEMDVIVNALKGVKGAEVVSDPEHNPEDVGKDFIMTFPGYNASLDETDPNKKDINNGIDITFKNNDTGIKPSEFDLRTPEFVTGQMIAIGQVMTHRIRELHIRQNVEFGKGKYVFVTSGINDQGEYSKMGQYQFVTEKLYLGTVKVNSPFLGGIFYFVSSPWGLLVLLLLPAAYLIIVSAKDIFKALKETEEGEAKENKTPSSLDTISNEDRERLKRELLDEMISKKQGEKKEDEQK